jgi:hypothetical protein
MLSVTAPMTLLVPVKTSLLFKKISVSLKITFIQGPVLQNFLRPLFIDFSNKLEYLPLASLSSLV